MELAPSQQQNYATLETIFESCTYTNTQQPNTSIHSKGDEHTRYQRKVKNMKRTERDEYRCMKKKRGRRRRRRRRAAIHLDPKIDTEKKEKVKMNTHESLHEKRWR